MIVCASRTMQRSFTLRPSSCWSMAVMAQRYSLGLGSTRDGGNVPGTTARVAPGATGRVADWIWARGLRFIWITSMDKGRTAGPILRLDCVAALESPRRELRRLHSKLLWCRACRQQAFFKGGRRGVGRHGRGPLLLA